MAGGQGNYLAKLFPTSPPTSPSGGRGGAGSRLHHPGSPDSEIERSTLLEASTSTMTSESTETGPTVTSVGVDVTSASETLESLSVSSPRARESLTEEETAVLNQKTLFRAVDSGNISALSGLLKARKADVNAFNDDGVSALMLAVYHYERRRSTEIISLLLVHGADPNLTMPVPADAHSERRICIIRDPKVQAQSSSVAAFMQSGEGQPSATTNAVGLGNTGSSLVNEVHSTRKIGVAGKTALLVALELKSALYLKGWDYRHWDAVILLLAAVTADLLESAPLATSGEAIAAAAHAAVANGWAAVFDSGRHEIVEVWAEGKNFDALKLVLTTNSKVLANIVESERLKQTGGSRHGSAKLRVELKEASYTVAHAIVEYLYSGRLNPEFMRLRGVDLLNAAHKFDLPILQESCIAALEANADNWMKLLSTALEVKSLSLVFKTAKNIVQTLQGRKLWRDETQKVIFAEHITPPVGGATLAEQAFEIVKPLASPRTSIDGSATNA